MKKLFDVNVDINLRLFYVLGWTACIANTIGFIANIILYGFTGMTKFCGICAIVMYFSTAWGIIGKQIRHASRLILLVINGLEFPILYYIYGSGRIAYMFLGLVGLIVFTDGKARNILAFATVVYHTAVIIFSALFSCKLVEVTPQNDLAAAVITYIVAAVSITLIITLIILQYQKQNEKMTLLAEELKQMAQLDPLTKLYNRRYLTEYIEERMRTENVSFAVALLDLDDFKSVNDRFGHVYGDKVLQAFADSMSAHIRGLGIAARFGGEEFMLVINTVDHDAIDAVMAQIQSDLGEYSYKTKGVRLTFSGGVEEFRNDDNKITKLFNAADRKL